MYSTDNGPHMNCWPDAAMTPFRSEKNSNWEGAYRVPAMVRWPGHIKAGTVANDIVSTLDWLPTLLAAAGVPDVKEQLLKGMKVGDTTFKVHLDGYNLLPYLTGEVPKSPRKEFFYFNDDSDWSRCVTTTGRLFLWNSRPRARWRSGARHLSPCACQRSSICAPTLTNAPTSRRTPITTGCLTMRLCSSRRRPSVGKFLATFKEFPPSQKSASFSLDKVMDKLKEGATGSD